MVVRTAKTDGSTFFACTAFPKCRNTKPNNKPVKDVA
jgi:ssDNA-binding Zn-finger/Zn-ribbon topoisomerase 1